MSNGTGGVSQVPTALFIGSGVALVTPFDTNGVNENVLRELVRFHLREGTDALVVNGSTGEASTMTPGEQRRAVEIVVDEAGGKIPVIAGAGGSDTTAVSRLASEARAAGATALLVSPPPYNKPTQQGIVAHYRAVMDAGGLPTIVYNVPGRTACNILPATVETLAEDDRIVGVKEASGDLSQVAELSRRVGERVAIYSGNDDQVVALMALGGMGVISVLANVAPSDVSRMARSFLEGDVVTARKLQLRLLPLINLLFKEPNPIPVKAAVRALGFDAGPLRLPLTEVSDALRGEVLAEMRALGLDVRGEG
ncbi:MAG TPA: 4-hydroxy-tetrahydrodipicolinate synthase [Longimicrobiaceae bacterium]|jgi:4-hydroxy-tetrahydrodipicolinate synthase|nr:4-hydroxy-tetrahydrodipicolinate synthase [Longimicrobiaceae bacterium]